MARKPQPATLADRIAQVDEAITETQQDLNDRALQVAQEPGNDRAHKALTDARTALENLQRQRSNLQLAQQKQREQASENAEAEQVQHLQDLRAKLDELLAERTEAAQKVADAIDMIAGPLAGLGVLEEDVRGVVASLHRLAGNEHRRVPDPAPHTVATTLHDRLYRSGAGRTGLPMRGVLVDPLPRGVDALPIEEAVVTDNERLVERVDHMLAPITAANGQPWYGTDQHQRAAEQRDAQAAMRAGKEQDERRKERTEKRVRDAGRPITRDAEGHVITTAEVVS